MSWRLTISFIHGAFNCDQARIDMGCKFSGYLSRHVTDLCAADILHGNGISKHQTSDILIHSKNTAHIPVISVIWFSDKADLFSNINKA